MGNLGRPPKSARARELYDQAKADHEEKAYKFRLQGRLVTEIATELGVSDRQVRTYLRRVDGRLRADLLARDGEAGVLKQFAVLNLLLEEALEAWEKSKAPSVKRSASKEFDEEGRTTKARVSETIEEQVGNPVYLDKAMMALKAVRDLLGLDAPTVRRIILQEGGEDEAERLNLDELSKLPTDRLLALYRAQVGIS